MALTSDVPERWQDLEIVVRDILRECGMTAENNVRVDLPRGQADVDVHATDEIDGISSTIICECKNWQVAVPRGIVFGFRTVMQEIGANRGYIVSRAGFQAGAVDAAQHTNVELVTFEQFQAVFFDRWINKRLWSLDESVGDLVTYYEPFGIPGIGLVKSEEEERAYVAVWERHKYLGVILMLFSPYGRMLKRKPVPALPFRIREWVDNDLDLPADLAAQTGYREFLEIVENLATEALEELRRHNPITNGDAAPRE